MEGWRVKVCVCEGNKSQLKSHAPGTLYYTKIPFWVRSSRNNLRAVVPVPNTPDGHLSSSVIVWVADGALVWVQPNDYRLWNVAFEKKKNHCLWVLGSGNKHLLPSCAWAQSSAFLFRGENVAGHGSKEVKGKTHTYYQVLIDARDCPHIVSNE